MATSDGDVTMTDAVGNASADTAPASSSTSQHSRTDHDRQYYFLPTQPLKHSRPHASQNLISDYGLDAVHDRVRRFDPKTGEKINKLRKSYVGIVKNLHLAGSNKEVPTPGQWLDTVNVHYPKGLMDKGMMEKGEEVRDGMKVPVFEDEFKVKVEAVSKQRAQGLLAKLGTAMQMAPGKLGEADKWKKLLGEDYPKKSAIPPVATLKAPVASSSAKPSPRLSPTAGRTQRTGAKRSYDESSFAGYNETYDDVERTTPAAELVRKKQRKVSFKSPKETPPSASKRKGRK
jgi:hypothetical protein